MTSFIFYLQSVKYHEATSVISHTSTCPDLPQQFTYLHDLNPNDHRHTLLCLTFNHCTCSLWPRTGTDFSVQERLVLVSSSARTISLVLGQGPASTYRTTRDSMLKVVLVLLNTELCSEKHLKSCCYPRA